MRILMVNDDPIGSGSGTEVHLLRLVDGLRAAGEQVEVFAGRVHHEGFTKILDVWDPIARRAVRRVADRFRPEVVHHHNVLRELSVSVLGVPPGAATVMTVHDPQIVGILDGSGSGPNLTRDHLRRLKLFKATFDRAVARRKVNAFIAPSAHMAERLRASGIAEVHWVPSFAPQPRSSGTPPSRSEDLLFAGRLVPEKGIHVLLDAFERVASNRPHARLLIAGDGPEAELIADRARALEGRILLLGRIDESALRDTMANVRAVVAPSVWTEGAGLTVVEAALAARPVVISDDPGLRELVDRSGCGLIVPKGDATALARSLEEILSNPGLADRLGAAGREVALRERTVEAAVRATLQVYEGATARARHG